MQDLADKNWVVRGLVAMSLISSLRCINSAKGLTLKSANTA